MPRFDEYTGENLIPPYRILDLTDRRAAFCGRLLADYGADVVKVEPPGATPRAVWGRIPPITRTQSGAWTSCSTTPTSGPSRLTWKANRAALSSAGWPPTPM